MRLIIILRETRSPFHICFIWIADFGASQMRSDAAKKEVKEGKRKSPQSLKAAQVVEA